MDPHFNPRFPNDVRIQDRGWWQNLVHFAQKHRPEGLMNATVRHFRDHFEFGSCLLDSRRLNQRYRDLRKLEDIGCLEDGASGQPRPDQRTRFVQFYTVCYKRRDSNVDLAQPRPSEDRDTGLLARDEEEDKYTRTEPRTDAVNNIRASPKSHRYKERLFCRLARADNVGQIDPLWKKVSMGITDEISAHTSLFLPGPHYEELVCEVGEAVVEWVTASSIR
ncbi:hypothetical protein TruAng_011013 [Truncatella angustata]|nr:hypothetical protein TruAng_011013 [Truncatella angustata]